MKNYKYKSYSYQAKKKEERKTALMFLLFAIIPIIFVSGGVILNNELSLTPAEKMERARIEAVEEHLYKLEHDSEYRAKVYLEQLDRVEEAKKALASDLNKINRDYKKDRRELEEESKDRQARLNELQRDLEYKSWKMNMQADYL